MIAVKKKLYIWVTLILTIIFLVGCELSNESKIAELEQKILELEETNEDNQIFINNWQSKYDDAKEMYDSTMSMNNPERRHLDYAKKTWMKLQKKLILLNAKLI